MAKTVWSYAATIPAGTPETALVEVDLGLSDQVVQQVDLQVPPGPLGCMGFSVWHSNTPILPRNMGDFFVWDNHYATWTLEDVPSGGGWQVVGYNTGQYDHTVYVVMHTDPVTTPDAGGRYVLPQYQGETFTEYERLLLT